MKNNFLGKDNSEIGAAVVCLCKDSMTCDTVILCHVIRDRGRDSIFSGMMRSKI